MIVLVVVLCSLAYLMIGAIVGPIAWDAFADPIGDDTAFRAALTLIWPLLVWCLAGAGLWWGVGRASAFVSDRFDGLFRG